MSLPLHRIPKVPVWKLLWSARGVANVAAHASPRMAVLVGGSSMAFLLLFAIVPLSASIGEPYPTVRHYFMGLLTLIPKLPFLFVFMLIPGTLFSYVLCSQKARGACCSIEHRSPDPAIAALASVRGSGTLGRSECERRCRGVCLDDVDSDSYRGQPLVDVGRHWMRCVDCGRREPPN